MPRLLSEAGLTLDSITPATAIFTDAEEADQILTIRSVTERAVAAGYLTGDQGLGMLNCLDTTPFFAAISCSSSPDIAHPGDTALRRSR